MFRDYQDDLSEYDRAFQEAEPMDDFEDIPDGSYQVVVDKVELTETKTSHKPMLSWRLKILSPQCVGRLLFKNSVITTDSIRWIKGDLTKCGLELEKFSDLKRYLHNLLDVVLEVKKVTKGEYDNVYFQRRLALAGESIPQQGSNKDDLPF